LKILVFTTLFPNNEWPNLGVFIKERMSAVAATKNCDIRVVAPIPYYPPIRVGWRSRYSQVLRKEVIDGISVYHPRYFLIPKIAMPFHGLMMFFSVFYFMKRLRREFAFDIIDAHYVYPDGLAAVLLGVLFRRPVVISARGSDINVFAQMPIIRTLVRYSLKKAKRVITVSRALQQVILGLGIPRKKISFVPNGVDPLKFYPVPKVKARNELGLPNERTLLLSVGGLTSVKNFELLIRAVKITIEEFGRKDLLLIIVGEGILRRNLERMIAAYDLTGHISLAGAVPHANLRLWYCAADLFCLVSKREGWPNVILESLACGTPVVASSVGGIVEMITSDTVGVLTEQNERAVADAIDLALKRNWKTDEIASYARQYSWQTAAISIVALFEFVLRCDRRLNQPVANVIPPVENIHVNKQSKV
jgi:teichuronic acid biosynthesis glycosyltransferase TuaC